MKNLFIISLLFFIFFYIEQASAQNRINEPSLLSSSKKDSVFVKGELSPKDKKNESQLAPFEKNNESKIQNAKEPKISIAGKKED